MGRSLSIIGAPSSIGIRPYDGGGARRLDMAPAVLRRQGLVARLGARDLGDVLPAPYRDFERTPGRVRNEAEVRTYASALAEVIAAASVGGAFVLVLGGDCSIVLGSLLGVRRAGCSRVGLVYLDGHADFGAPEESRTGSAASMCLSLAVGRGDTPLARLGGARPLAHPGDVALLGRRDEAEPWYGHAALRALGLLDVPGAALAARAPAATAAIALACVARPELDGFWIHVDADVLDPAVMPAVDSPVPGGPGFDALRQLLAPLVRHPRALGLELTIYDPTLDREGACAAGLASLLVDSLGASDTGSSPS